MNALFKFGWYFLILAMIGDVAASFILPLFYSGYSPMKMSISALGNPKSPVRLPFNLWMLVEGILFLLALPVLYRNYIQHSQVTTWLLIVFVAVFAVGACIFTCFFSVNESREVVTVASKIHGAGSTIGFMLFLFVPLLAGLLSFKCDERVNGIICIVSFIISLAFFVLFVMSDKEEFKNTFIDNEGLWQRLNLVFMYLPLVVIAFEKIFKAK